MKHARCHVTLLVGLMTSCGGAEPTAQPAQAQTIQSGVAGAAKDVPVAGNAGAPSAATTSPVFAVAGTSSATAGASGAAGLGSSGFGGVPSAMEPAGSGAAAVAAAAGAVAPPLAAGAGAQTASAGAQTATAGAGATKAGSCPAGEMCQVSMIGNFKFCAPMTQSLPPNCSAANSPCGNDMKGTCFDAAAIGFAGMLYCLYLTCM